MTATTFFEKVMNTIAFFILALLLLPIVLLVGYVVMFNVQRSLDAKTQQQIIEKYVHGLKPGDDASALKLDPCALVPVDAASFDHLFVHFGPGRLIVLAIKRNLVVSSYVDVYNHPQHTRRWLAHNGVVLVAGRSGGWPSSAYKQYALADDHATSVAREMGKVFAERKDEIARMMKLPGEDKAPFQLEYKNLHFRSFCDDYLDFIKSNFSRVSYIVKYAKIKPEFKGGDWEAYWNSPAWQQANTVTVDHGSTDSTQTRPAAQAKVLYDETGIWLLWKVEDADTASSDSKVVFFFEPVKDYGYVNVETHAGGACLLRVHKPVPEPIRGRYIYEPEYQEDRPEPPDKLGRLVQVRKSLPEHGIDAHANKSTTWYIETFVPSEVLRYVYSFETKDLSGVTSRGNFCWILDSKDPAIAAHNHLGAWSPLQPGISNPDQPANFAPIRFETPVPES